MAATRTDIKVRVEEIRDCACTLGMKCEVSAHKHVHELLAAYDDMKKLAEHRVCPSGEYYCDLCKKDSCTCYCDEEQGLSTPDEKMHYKDCKTCESMIEG